LPTPPAGYSITIPTGAPPPDPLNDPFYKQNTAWLEEDAAKKQKRLLEDKTLAEQLYAINVAQASASRGGGGDYGLGAAEAQAALQREQATHDDKLREEQIREIMASRGMHDSGQLPFEQQERQFDLTMLNKGIDADLAARAAAASSARSSAQAGLAEQLQEMALRHGANMTGFNRDLEDLPGAVARERGGYLFEAYNRLNNGQGAGIPAFWDEASGLYQAANGDWYDANKNKVSGPSAAPAYVAPGQPGGVTLSGDNKPADFYDYANATAANPYVSGQNKYY
jgi:hypothetical protein